MNSIKRTHNTLKYIFQLKQDDLFKVLVKYLKNKYGKNNVVIREKFVMAFGEIPIALVAHLDTVHKRQPEVFFEDKEKNVLWSPQGLGADDRAGVYAIIKLIEAGYRPNIIFTKDEETGGDGADEVVKVFPECPFPELRFIIELDRCGEKDCVFYHCANRDFEKLIESFGFETDLGSFSDISIIAPVWKIAAVNLSIGYFYEHSLAEFLNLKYMNDTIEKVKNILNQAYDLLSFEYIPAIYRNQSNAYCTICNNFILKQQGYIIFTQDIPMYSCANCIKYF